ncbi:hypothetical protein GE09DRAFT_1090501 [Coniochaeta sp. 2T2.1]|nr:hypothetical protein GE09DRAFT_1090501 [Coniochaeta sp. 2T2.1]
MPPLTFFPTAGEDTEMSTGSVIAANANKAAQACVPCRKQKRKCDKGLPACGLCSRMGRPCDYSEVHQTPTAEDLSSMQMKILELEQRLNQKEQQQQQQHQSQNGSSAVTSPNGHSTSSGGTPGPSASFLNAVSEKPPLWMPAQSKFPSAMFLDIDCFIYASLPVPKPAAEIPMDVLEILSNANALQQAVTDYFNTVHCWFPIISKKRMNMGHPLFEGGSDLAMLFLAMKLVSSQPVNGVASADSHLYIASKRFLALLESSGTVSIMYLQAMMLVAIYEFGHSIYPAAWMTIGACSRYAEILGLPSYKDTVVILGQAATWTELEERRRVWWGIFILDRVICIGNKRRPFATEPGPNDILPMNDTAWDQGDVANALQSTVAAPLTDPQGPFARLCQAAILIDRVESHLRQTIKRHKTRDPEPFSLSEVESIIDELTLFSSIVASELAGPSPPPSNNNPSPPQQQQQPQSPPSVFTYPSPMYSNSTNTNNNDSASSTSTSTTSPYSNPSPSSSPPTPQSHIPPLLPPHFLTFSSLILLYDLYCCPEDLLTSGPGSSSEIPKTAASLHLQVRAVTGIRSVSLAVRDAGVELLEFVMLPANLAKVGPLVLDSLYAAMATLHWLWKESGEEEVGRALEDVKRTLARLDMRWRLARDYLGLERYHDVTTVMEWRAR